MAPLHISVFTRRCAIAAATLTTLVAAVRGALYLRSSAAAVEAAAPAPPTAVPTVLCGTHWSVSS
jgi:hypothetical protein